MTSARTDLWKYIVLLTLATASLHPDIFSWFWAILLLMALLDWPRLFSRSQGSALLPTETIWLVAFGPLLIAYMASALIHSLTIGRIEALEPVLGGALLAAALERREQLRFDWLVHGSALGGLAAAGLVAIEILVFNESRAGMQHQPINFGMACGAFLLILVIYLQNNANKYFLWTAVACSIGLIGSGSRGPILAFFICILALVALKRPMSRPPPDRRRQWVIGFLLLGFTAFWVIQKRFLGDLQLGESSSVSTRWQLIEVSLQQILLTPFVGIGADQGGKFFAAFSAPIQTLNHAHMTVLNLALELGVFGALAWLWGFGVMLYLFWKLYKKNPYSEIGMTGMLITAYIFICSMTQDLMSHAFNRRFFSMMLVFLFVLLSFERKRTSQAEKHGSRLQK